MINKIIERTVKWDQVVLKLPVFNAIFTAMQQTLPLLTISVYLQLIISLFLKPDAFFIRLFHLSIKVPMLMQLQDLSLLLDLLVLMLFSAIYTGTYLSSRHVFQTTLPVITNFLGTFFLLLGKDKLLSYDSTQYLLLVIIVTLSSESFVYYHKKVSRPNVHPFAMRFLLWAGIILVVNIGLQMVSPSTFIYQAMSSLTANVFWTSFLGLLLISCLIPLFFWLGISIPRELVTDQINIPAVVKNLDVVIKNQNGSLPYPTNLYSVYHAFSQFGGIGNTVVLSFLLLFAVSKKRQNLGLLSLVPSLFNQNQLLYFGLPIFLRPLMLVPMIITSVVGTLIGYTAIMTHLIKPATLVTPSGMPNLLLAFLGSNDGWSLLVVAIIFGLSVIIYMPFIKIQNSETIYEK